MIIPGSDEFEAIIGVTTHTFHLDETGNLDESAIQSDEFGSYIKDVVISPLAQAEKLKDVLTMDPTSIPLPVFDADPRSICGYDSYSKMLSESQAAVDFFAASPDFKPTFWVNDSDASTITFFDQMMRNVNDQFKVERQDMEERFPWAKSVYQDFDRLRKHSKMSKLTALDIGHLGITESYEECDTIACTDYGGFVIKANAKELDRLFATMSHDSARRAVAAVMGHELGHYILDYYLLKKIGHLSLDDAMATIGALNYHLTVDGIGIVLNELSSDEFSGVLKDSLAVSVFGDKRLVADSEDRVMCLEQLPRVNPASWSE